MPDESMDWVPGTNLYESREDDDGAMILHPTDGSSEASGHNHHGLSFNNEQVQQENVVQASQNGQHLQIEQLQTDDQRQYNDESNTSVTESQYQLNDPLHDNLAPFVGYQHRIVSVHEFRQVFQQRTKSITGQTEVQYTYAAPPQSYPAGTTEVSTHASK